MDNNKKIIEKFFSNSLNKKEKKEFIMLATEDNKFLASLVKELELRDAVDNVTGESSE